MVALRLKTPALNGADRGDGLRRYANGRPDLAADGTWRVADSGRPNRSAAGCGQNHHTERVVALCARKYRAGLHVRHVRGLRIYAFTQLPDIEPEHTYALCNEVSDHLPIYMWGRVARRYLNLTAQGYHIATSVHADTNDDVIYMYQHDLRLTAEEVRRLGLIVNIGLVGHIYPLRRRWLTTHFLQAHPDPKQPHTVVPLPLSLWNEFDDTFEHADQPILDDLADWACMTPAAFSKALKLRADCKSAQATRRLHARACPGTGR